MLYSEWIQDLIAVLVFAYLKLCYATTRWDYLGREAADAVWKSSHGAVMVFWHERLHLGHHAWPNGVGQPLCVLASGSKAGDVSVKINQRFGHVSVRGSSAKKSDPSKNKGGANAFRELLRWLKDHKGVAMTPDGPRGPRRSMSEGTLRLTQLTGAPMVLVGAATSRFIEAKSWDRMRIPLPFSKGVVIYEVIPAVPRDLDEAEMQAAMDYVKTRLDFLTDQADQVLGLSLHEPPTQGPTA